AATRGKDQLQVRVERVGQEPPAAPRLVVVQAVPKGERGELAVAAMTEVGVDVVVPWAAERCVVSWRAPERAARGVSRWRRTARESAKQARRSYLPEVTELADTAPVTGLLAAAAAGVVLHEQAMTSLPGLRLPTVGDIVLVIGPEGGISPTELAGFATAGAEPVRLGPTVLRSSTAGTAAAAVVLAATGRWA
ncbi:MAG TPA: 16S rRNA (uracil(1498)-N(3))-methyltransferase, partial [Candidatus Nanopelagicales bacterium]|nr:16S rRNA (uracil(1498)-N(3))-methyltransferase [Candidatus Nanopelagicales bacterium]